jgi:anti-sigma B factor antagonist
MSELTITKKQEGSTLTIFVGGRIDTATSPQLDTEAKASIEGISKLILDIGKVSYISSSGLRVLLSLHKAMDANGGKLIVSKPTEMVLEVFDVTGFADMLNIEE